jgi:hypothetical protein
VCAQLDFYCGFTEVHAPRPFLHPSAPFAEFVSFFMRFYSWLVRKWFEILGYYRWLLRKLREIIDNYSWRALLWGRLPRPHFLDLDRAPWNGHFVLHFVFKPELKPFLVTLGPFGIHLGNSLAIKIRILDAIPKRFLRIWRFAGTQNSILPALP